MRFQVPQFVDIEDKIIGPLTLKQFGMYALATMVLVILYAVLPVPLLVTVAVPILGVAVLFAHVRISGQSFAATIAHLFSYLLSARLFLWRRGGTRRLPVSGPEYAELADLPEGSSALGLIAQALTTQGTVVDADAADTIGAEAGEIEKPEREGRPALELRQEGSRRASAARPHQSEGGVKAVSNQ